MDDVEKRHLEIPRDREIILYCSCPNEVTSARVALLLRRKGITAFAPFLAELMLARAQVSVGSSQLVIVLATRAGKRLYAFHFFPPDRI